MCVYFWVHHHTRHSAALDGSCTLMESQANSCHGGRKTDQWLYFPKNGYADMMWGGGIFLLCSCGKMTLASTAEWITLAQEKPRSAVNIATSYTNSWWKRSLSLLHSNHWKWWLSLWMPASLWKQTAHKSFLVLKSTSSKMCHVFGFVWL